uniref:alpha-aminoadipic semialdehyde synthase, mitochondrial isoform X2 n=1 Tax=Myxine glutinosa TaxID=7769 RepID=UPI00358EC73D
MVVLVLIKKPIDFEVNRSKGWLQASLSARNVSAMKCRQISNWGTPTVLGIRREDVSPWERRAPLAPSHVKQIVDAGHRVLMQPSHRRAIPAMKYEKAGAVIQEDLSDAKLIMGVKRPPDGSLLPGKTYSFFSHTIKAQESNMLLLNEALSKGVRLLDYEAMVNEEGHRVVAFGKWAGIAGMIDILHGLGLRLLELGFNTPFMHMSMAHNYRTFEQAMLALRDVGYEIALGQLPAELGPMTFVFSGTGNVSQGAQKVFRELPCEFVRPKDLPKIIQQADPRKVYGVVVSPLDYLQRTSDGGFNLQEFFKQPELYSSHFNTKIAPYTSCLINGVYWNSKIPRLLTREDAVQLTSSKLGSTHLSPGLPYRMLAISDISSDVNGSIAFMSQCTTIDEPFCIYHPDKGTKYNCIRGEGILICSIDQMPTQLPVEATHDFGDHLLPYVPELLGSDASKPLKDQTQFSSTVRKAIVASNGVLTPRFEFIKKVREQREWRKATEMKSGRNVLILGSGFVSTPVVNFLSQQLDTSITVASQIPEQLARLTEDFPNTRSIHIDAENEIEKLGELIKEYHVVISLLPKTLHAGIAKLCIDQKVNMVTTSYVLPEMQALHESAQAAGITLLNEVGLDPGIDHILALNSIHSARQRGATVESLVSYCGGLPAPEFTNNPLRYKFSWNPEGAIGNVLTSASYLRDGQCIEISSGGKIVDAAQPVCFWPGLNLEGVPNRDSLHYCQLYSIPEAQTVLRGTLRYQGTNAVWKSLLHLGLFDSNPNPNLFVKSSNQTWSNLMSRMLGVQMSDSHSLREAVKRRLNGDEAQTSAIEQLGLLGDAKVGQVDNVMKALINHLACTLTYGSDERDMVILRNELKIKLPSGAQETEIQSLVVYGDPKGYSAMAKTVGLPCAIATQMLLDGMILEKGVVMPFAPEIFNYMLLKLKNSFLFTEEVK